MTNRLSAPMGSPRPAVFLAFAVHDGERIEESLHSSETDHGDKHMDRKTFDSVQLGERVGHVDGPGVFPTDRVSLVVDKEEDRFGCHLIVAFPDGSETTVWNFTAVGIGCYRLDHQGAN